ncbi:putative copper binding proteins, plastocyanin/azurin family protein [Lyophyllum shimeji]|uniref:Copper binding proteins, plastocyanin/azurin family protein n=1 Tax=Lyophyllum shimeji TaxID=47721 RepID=A0A9P3PGZ0_LYOSH|nr:putative copper binding proteins, plastocyanin/azurin family protein [Lyophyllum shimeji]
MLAAALVVIVLPTFAAAQYGPPPSGPTTTAAAAVPSAPADTPGHMNIDVAFQGQFVFHPANITAPNGTFVTFWFPNTGLDHSVTQSSFAAPCTYLAATSNSTAGFDSGLQSAKTFTINITDDTKPIWYHCKQVGHCGMGMAGSINAPATGNTHDKFVAAAMAIGGSEVTENDNGPVTGGVNGIATAAPAASTGGAGGSGSSAATSLAYNAPLALLAGALALSLALL